VKITYNCFCSAGVVNSVSRKDELFNDLIDECASRGIDFHETLVEVDGKYIIQVHKNKTTCTLTHFVRQKTQWTSQADVNFNCVVLRQTSHLCTNAGPFCYVQFLH
jgi:hypothetical protein